jgi:DNA-binding transcriptional regulator GbsR (MarR family)
LDLTPVERKFVLHWGEMGARWGVNRTVAQVHALLMVSPKPIPAEEIAKTLSVARSGVSGALRELESWGVLRTTHALGDRREYFETLEDPWEMFRRIFEERKRRELDPTLRALQDCAEESRGTGARGEHARKRFADLLELFETMDAWYRRVNALPRGLLLRFLRAGGKG